MQYRGTLIEKVLHFCTHAQYSRGFSLKWVMSDFGTVPIFFEIVLQSYSDTMTILNQN